MIACEIITMRALRLPIAIAFALAAAFGQHIQQPRPDAHAGQLRIDTTLVLVPVEVSDVLNRPVSGLEKQNFHVSTTRWSRRSFPFRWRTIPSRWAWCSTSAEAWERILREMRHAASQFFKTSNPGDEFCLVELASNAQVAVPLTQNAADVDYKLMFSKGGGSTALLDGVYLGLNEVRKSKNLAEGAGDHFRRRRES